MTFDKASRIKRGAFCFSQVKKRFLKGHLLCCKRWPFSVQYAAFCIVKGGILQFVKSLDALCAV